VQAPAVFVIWAIAGAWFAGSFCNVSVGMVPKSENVCTVHLRQLIVEAQCTPSICWAIGFDSEHFLISVGDNLELPRGILVAEGQGLC